MNKCYSHIVRINTILTMVICLLFDYKISAQGQTNTSETNPEYTQILTNMPPPGFATRLDYLRSFTTEKDILDAYHSGSLNKGEAMIAMEALGDRASMDTYGEVRDQDGQPVVGARVRGNVDISGDFIPHYTETDAQGRFSFLGLHGTKLFIQIGKDGYDFNSKALSERPSNYLPDSNNPLVFTMWKLRGAEPMVHSKIHAYIPCDGSLSKFNLLTGKEDSNGDLIVSLTRNPLNIDRHKPFNWSVTFEIPNGGLQDMTNLYPNEAPVEGYQSNLTLEFPTNMNGWQKEFNHTYYFKSKGGQVYGRIEIDVDAEFQPPPTYFDAEIYANPAGSRNLEFDYKKQIRK